MQNISLWKAIAPHLSDFPSLKNSLDVDVVIIGAGITGLTTALELIKSGKQVAILEEHKMGENTTAYSTGNLYAPVQPYLQTIMTKFGIDVARDVAASRQDTINYIEDVVKACNIACHFFRRPWYLHTNDEKTVGFLDREYETLQKLNLEVERVTDFPLPLPIIKAIKLNHQARINPVQYIYGLIDYLKNKNCQLYENTRVINIDEKKDITIVTTQHNIKINAKYVVIATHTPLGFNSVQLFTAPYRSYVISVHLKDHDYPDGNFWDLRKPHHAISTHPIHKEHPELLMVAGSHHKTGQAKDADMHYQDLKNYLNQHFSVEEIAYQWSAQHYQAADDLPYIGLASRGAKRTYMATGFFADGLVYGSLAGRILSDTILAKQNKWSVIYNSQRFTPIISAPFLVTEGGNVAMQYLKDYVGGLPTDVAELKPGHAKVVKINNERCAAFRDEEGKLHLVSAVCTHMKCIVHWNNAERTWDCPCHGSRFDFEGKVLEGPAVFDLEKKKI